MTIHILVSDYIDRYVFEVFINQMNFENKFYDEIFYINLLYILNIYVSNISIVQVCRK